MKKLFKLTLFFSLLLCCFALPSKAAAGGISSVSVSGKYYYDMPETITITTNATCWETGSIFKYIEDYYYGVTILSPTKSVLFDNTDGGERFAYGQDYDDLVRTESISVSYAGEGTYTIYIQSYNNNTTSAKPSGYENPSTYTFTIDRTAPTGTLKGVANGGITNTGVSFDWSDSLASATYETYNLTDETKNTYDYTKNNQLYGVDGKIVQYTLTLKDKAGNSTPYTFTIDRIKPTGTLTGVSNGGITNGDFVYFSWDEAGCTATLNGNTYAKNQPISAQRLHTLVLTDAAGNSTPYTFTIDRTAPTGTLKGVGNNGTSKGPVSFIWSEAGCTATLKTGNGTPVTYTDKEKGITVSGIADKVTNYTIVLTDAAGNSTTYTFTIDLKKPIPSMHNSDGSSLSDGAITNKDVWISWTEAAATGFYKFNDGNFTPYLKTYYYYVNDPSTKYQTYTQVFAKILEIETEKIVSISAWDGSGTVYTDDADYAKTGAACWSYDGYLFFREETKETYLNRRADTLWETSTRNLLTEEGTYTFQLVDSVGNVTERTFTIDKTAPTITNTKSNVSYFFDTTLRLKDDCIVAFSASDNYLSSFVWNNSSYDGRDINSSDFADGTYYFVATDAAGNQTKITIIIDKTAPEGQLIGVDKGGVTNSSVSFSWGEAGCTATLDGESYANGTLISGEGDHEILLTDAAGNQSEPYTFTIDLTPPECVLEGVDNHGVTKNTVTIKWNISEIATITINGLSISPSLGSYTIHGTQDAEQAYSIILTDIAGNKTEKDTYTFTIDLEKPIPSMQNSNGSLLDGGVTTKDVWISWTDAAATGSIKFGDGSFTSYLQAYYYYVNDPSTKYGTQEEALAKILEIEAEKIVSISAWDGTGTVYTDDTNYAQTGAACWSYDGYLFFREETKEAYLNKTARALCKSSSQNLLTEEGTYTFKLVDAVGNETVRTFTIDKTAPTLELIGVSNEGATKEEVTIRWTESTAIIFSNGSQIEGELEDSFYLYNFSGVDGDTKEYVVNISDAAGNSTSYSFTIDRTAPEGELSGVVNGGVTNKDVWISWTEAAATGSIKFGDGSFTSYLQAYYYYVNDPSTKYGTQEEALAKILEIEAEKIVSISAWNGTGAVYSEDANYAKNGAACWSYDGYLFFREETKEAYLNKTARALCKYSAHNLLTGEGTYTFILSDSVGNTTEYTFTIDRTAPEGELRGVDNTGATPNSVSFSWSESGCTATLNGNPYTKNQAVKEEGVYTLVLTDAAGNQTEYTFTIDRTAPEGELIGVANGGVTNGSVSFTWSEAGCTATLDGNIYIAGTDIQAESAHTLVLTDAAGNQTEYKFTIDKTPPTGTLSGVSNGGSTSGTVTFTWSSEDTATYQGSPLMQNQTFSEGPHTIILTDAAGNQTEYTFTIDRTAPEGELNGVANGGVTNGSVSFTWSESGCTASLDGNTYIAGTDIQAEGAHTIILTDAAGNSSTYTFTIDKTPPVLSFSACPNTIGDRNYFNSSVSFSWSEVGCTATLDGVSYTSGTPVSGEGDHEVLLTDAVGNTTSFLFTIDTTKYTKNYENFLATGHSHLTKWYQTYYYTLHSQAYIHAGYYSFSNIEDARKYSEEREYAIVEYHEKFSGEEGIQCYWANRIVENYDISNTDSMEGHPFYIYFDIADKNKLVAYFDTTNLDRAIKHYAEVGISTMYVPSSPAPAFPGSDSVPAQKISRDEIFIQGKSVSWRYAPSDITLYINGKICSYSDPLQTGYYIVEEVDLAGNSTKYELFVDNTAPGISIYDATENTIPSYEQQFANTSVYFGKHFSLQVKDNYDNAPLLVVTIDGEKHYLVNERFTFEASGIYTIDIYDLAGNKRSHTIYLSLEQISVKEEIVKTPTGTTLGTSISIDTVLDFNKVYALTISQFDTGISEWIVQTQDSNGQAISPSSLNYYFAMSGKYLVTALDNFGRTTEYEFEVRKDAPTGTVYTADGIELQKKASTTKIVYFIWDDDSCTATLNGLVYTKKSYISEEGNYTLVLTDLNGNFSEYTFTIDRTAPEGELKGVTNGGNTNQTVSFTWSDETESSSVAYISKDKGKYYPYTKDAAIVADGSYSLKLVDAAGNSTLYSFTMDTVAPTVIIVTSSGDQLQSGALTNQTIYFQWSEVGCTATLNGDTYSSKKRITENGQYSLYVRDMYGNFVVLSVTIDKAAPEGELNGVANGGVTNGSASFTWSEAGCTASLDGNTYIAGTDIQAEGEHTLVLTDAAGNSTTYAFTIDRTAPEGTLNGVDKGGFTNTSVSFTWSEAGCTATRDGETYTKKSAIFAEGEHTIVLTDAAGNSSTYTFTIDRTAPIGNITTSYIDITGVWYVKSDTSFTWSESGCTATLDGNTYIAGTDIQAEGEHTLVLTDAAGNSTTYQVVVDKTAPQGSFSSVATMQGDKYYFNTFVFATWMESGVSATLDGNTYQKRTYINNDGEYVLTLTDLAGNSTTYIFIVDKTAPECKIVGSYNLLNSTYYFKEDFCFTWTELGYMATLDGDTYYSGDYISDEGTYTFILEDEVGNRISFVVTLDKTAPTPSFSTQGKDVNGVLYFNMGISINWDEPYLTATIDSNSYTKKSAITAEGAHTLVLTDAAGNRATVPFVIDTVAPKISFNAPYTTNFSILYFNTTVKLSWNEEGCIATLNDAALEKNSLLSLENTYKIVLTDAAGNSTTYQVVVDKTAPTGTLKGVSNGGITNTYVSFTWDESGCTATLDGNSFKKGNYIYDVGPHTIVLSDIAGNQTEYTFTIDIDFPEGELRGVTNGGITKTPVFLTWSEAGCTATLNGNTYTSGEEIAIEGEYTLILTNEAGNSTTYTFTIDKTAPIGSLIGVTNGGIAKTAVFLTWSEAGCTATLNGNAYTKKSSIDDDGLHTLVLTDAAGNSSTYAFTIDRTAPEGEMFGVANGGVTNGSVSFTWSEAGCTASLDGNTYIAGTDIQAEGAHTLILTDAAGNQTEYTFTIDRKAPEGELNGVVDGGITNNSVFLTWSEADYTATLDGEAYIKKSAITAEGAHTLILTDAAGNSTPYTFTIDRTAPEGEMFGVANGGVTNGSVSFTWSEAGCTATLDGNTYIAGTDIQAEGAHTLALTDAAGNQTYYTFTIDRTAPIGTLMGATNGGITNQNVYFSWLDKNASAIINGVEYQENSVVVAEGEYTIILSDSVGNKTFYSFTIDKTAPVGKFSTTATETLGMMYFQKDCSFTWTELGITVLLDKQVYENGTILSEGAHTLVLTDAAGNSTEYKFVVDKTPPTGTLSGVVNGGITNQNVSFTWSGDSCTATLDGNTFKKDAYISAEGLHTITLTDAAGNRTFYTFTIDKTAPRLSFVHSEEELEDIKTSNLYVSPKTALSITAFDTNLKTFSWNEEPIEKSVSIIGAELQDGSYSLVATDKAGNTTILTVLVDTTAPEGAFSVEAVETENGIFFTQSVKFTWDEEGCSASLNGEPYRLGTYIFSDGKYSLTLTDAAGNAKDYIFNILTSTPSTNIIIPPASEGGTEEIVEGVGGKRYSYAHSVEIAPMEGTTVFINGEEISQETELSTPGEYTITVLNAANVSKEITIVIFETEETQEGEGSFADIALMIVSIIAVVSIGVLITRNILRPKKIKTKRL